MWYRLSRRESDYCVECSEDGIHFERLMEEPLLANGKPGSWNESESGHPYIFEDEDKRVYLFIREITMVALPGICPE